MRFSSLYLAANVCLLTTGLSSCVCTSEESMEKKEQQVVSYEIYDYEYPEISTSTIPFLFQEFPEAVNIRNTEYQNVEYKEAFKIPLEIHVIRLP